MCDIAGIIVNISVDKLDRPFDYLIPDELRGKISEGTPVVIPFGKGNKETFGYVVELKEDSEWDRDRLKSILRIREGELPVEGYLLGLAAWIRRHYGSTMNEAIRTVLPVRARVKSVEEHWLNLIIGASKAMELADEEERHGRRARARLIRSLIEGPMLLSEARSALKTTKSVTDALTGSGVISITDKRIQRMPTELKSADKGEEEHISLTDEQRSVLAEYDRIAGEGKPETYLLYGVTGSGKTEVYMEMLSRTIHKGRQAIVLIPEIALTHQIVSRFINRFGDRVSVIHSRMSVGERYDQFMRAKNHEVDIVVGPRSALFAPFDNIGLIIIDEEHEGSYQSEKNPSYHAREVAMKRAKDSSAMLVLGSATPSLNSYLNAMEGRYRLLRLTKRATGAPLPKVYVTDLREELKARNHSIFGRLLKEKINDRLEKGEQTMLFLNRRGYAGFVSCRSCGFVVKCSHCDVSMTAHGKKNDPYLICHYCGETRPMPKKCPSCGSPYIAAFGLGTEKVAELVAKEFPAARVLRMDADTTKNKGGHERVMSPFRQGKADILVGTQMIVKGHDLPRVTLVGAVAADLSLFQGDYKSFEKTYQLLEQAGGRAGRGETPGEFIIQTYQPESYCIRAVAEHDPELFYKNELAVRRLASYPPYSAMLKVLVSAASESVARADTGLIAERLSGYQAEGMSIIGPAPDRITFMKDRYRYCLYIKSADDGLIERAMSDIDKMIRNSEINNNTYVSLNRG